MCFEQLDNNTLYKMVIKPKENNIYQILCQIKSFYKVYKITK